MKQTIEFQLENDPIISELYKEYKPGKVKSSEFRNIYKNLIGLGYSQNEIHEYFELEDDYKNFIKSYL